MNETGRAGFLRRLVAFVIDAFLILTLATIVTMAWAVAIVRVLPDTASNVVALLAASQTAVPDLLPEALFVYVAASWTAVFGHRSVGMRVTGLQVIRALR